MADRTFAEPNSETGWNYKLIIDGQNGKPHYLFVNPMSLAVISPVFHRIFFDPKFADSSKKEMHMTGKVYEEFLEFLRCVAITFDGEYKRVDSNNIEVLLEYADEYQVGSLKKRCQKFLDKQSMKPFDTSDERAELARYFVIACKANLVVDNLITKLSKFPVGEIKAIGELVQYGKCYAEVLHRKMEVYAQMEEQRIVKRAYKRVVSDKCSQQTQCAVCGRDSANCLFYRCEQCVAGLESLQLCRRCYDNHHVPLFHTQSEVSCPRCRALFRPSSETEPDRCRCE